MTADPEQTMTIKAANMRAIQALQSLLKISIVASNPELVDAIEDAINTFDRLDEIQSRAKARELAKTTESVDCDPELAEIRQDIDSVRSDLNAAEYATGLELRRLCNRASETQKAVERRLDRYQFTHLVTSNGTFDIGRRSSSLVESDITAHFGTFSPGSFASRYR